MSIILDTRDWHPNDRFVNPIDVAAPTMEDNPLYTTVPIENTSGPFPIMSKIGDYIETGLSYLPVVGTVMDIDNAIKNPSWSNTFFAGMSLASDLTGAWFAKPLIKWKRALKLAQTLIDKADYLELAARTTTNSVTRDAMRRNARALRLLSNLLTNYLSPYRMDNVAQIGHTIVPYMSIPLDAGINSVLLNTLNNEIEKQYEDIPIEDNSMYGPYELPEVIIYNKK